MSLPVIIRPASPEDAEALLSIYAPYVKHTAITFEYEVPSAEEFQKRIAHTLQHYPYLVAEREINSSAPGIITSPSNRPFHSNEIAVEEYTRLPQRS